MPTDSRREAMWADYFLGQPTKTLLALEVDLIEHLAEVRGALSGVLAARKAREEHFAQYFRKEMVGKDGQNG